jgi:hypothetical protein
MPVSSRTIIVLLLLPFMMGMAPPVLAVENSDANPAADAAMTTDPADLPLRRAPDVRLLLDLSAFGPDTHEDLPAALSLLFKAVPDDALAGIWTWGTEAHELLAHGPVDLSWKRAAELAVRSLARSPRGSDISEQSAVGLAEALLDASWDVDESSNRQRHIVIVTDAAAANPDVPGGASISPAIADSLVAGLSAADIRVHLIRTTDQAGDQGLLALAERTGGLLMGVAGAGSGSTLGSAFEQLTGFTSQPPSIPVDAGSFLVEPGLREVTLRVEGDDPRLVLVDPHGKTYSRAKPGDRVSWHDARGFDVITIKRPAAGRWKFGEAGNYSVFAWGDLVLRVEPIPATLFPGNLNAIDFMLFQGGEPVDDAYFADVASASARLVGEGEAIPVHVSRKSGGLYRVEMVNEAKLGDYVLEVRVDGPTFARRSAIPFRIDHPVKVHVAQRGKDVVAWVRLLDPAIDSRTLKVAAGYRMPPNPRTLVPAKAMPGGFWQLTVPKAIDAVEVSWSVFGRYRNQKKFELHTETLRVEVPVEAETVFGFDAAGRVIEDRDPDELLLPKEPDPEGERAKDAAASGPAEPVLPLWMVIVVALVNLGITGGGAWFVMRKRPDPELQAWLDSRAAEPVPETAPA